jgi:DNA-binding NarL/FixJ family response regulator
MSAPAAPVRIVVADDHQIVRSGFAGLLDTQPDFKVVGTAEDGAEAVRVCRETSPDVVLMDVRMPGMDGIEATQRMPHQKVLILTTFGLDDYIIEALRAGANGFLLKDAPVEELVRAVRTVAAGDAQLSPAVTKRLLDQVARRLPPAVERHTGALAQLTEREREVLRLLAVGMSNAEIAAALVVSEPTVKTHVSSLLQKLGLRNRVQAVIYAYENGLIAPGDR